MESRSPLEIKMIRLYSSIYIPDGFDPFELTLNGLNPQLESTHNRIVLNNKLNNFIFNDLTMATSFFGLPNRLIENEQSPRNIGKNLIGWQDHASDLREGFNATKAGTHALINIALVIPKFALNVAKLFTELLPGVVDVALDHAAKLADNAAKQSESPAVQYGYKALSVAASVGSAVAKATRFIGGAITSPINNPKRGMQLGKQIAGDGIGGKALGFVLAGLSVVMTTAACVGIGIVAAPLIAAAAPSIAAGISAVGSTIGSALGVSSFTAGVATLAGAAGLAASTVGIGVSKLYDKCVNFWYSSGKKEPKSTQYEYTKNPGNTGNIHGGMGTQPQLPGTGFKGTLNDELKTQQKNTDQDAMHPQETKEITRQNSVFNFNC